MPKQKPPRSGLLTAPLSDEELDDLAACLESIPTAMSIEQLDGFLTGLVCSPELVMPSSYFPHIFGEDHEFQNVDEVRKFTSLILRHWNSISKQVRTSTEIDPLLIEHEGSQGVGNEWAEGFLLGMALGGESWKDLVNDEEHGGLLVPIFALAHEHNPDPKLRPDPITEDKRELMLAGICIFVPKIFQYFGSHRKIDTSQSKISSQSLTQEKKQKIGRNEPCPCGSFRKYKHCCGKN